MINWREGKAGFVGNAKRLIKGVFQHSFTVTSAEQPPTVPGLEFTMADKVLEYTLKTNRLHYEMPIGRLHYTMEEED